MKAFKKLALVTAIAAAPFAQAEMVAIDDALMGEMTGQSGISIELDASVSIGSVVYTDTDTAGTLSLNSIALGGYDGSTNAVSGGLDDIKIDIDVDADNLIIHLGTPDSLGAFNGTGSADFGLSVGSVNINSNAANLASNIFIGGNLGPIDVVIANNGDIAVDAYFEVTTGQLDLDVLGMGVTNLKISGSENHFANGAYSADFAKVGTSLTSIQGALAGNLADSFGLGTLDLAGATAAVTVANDGVFAAQSALAADDGADAGVTSGLEGDVADAIAAAELVGAIKKGLEIETVVGLGGDISQVLNTSGVENMAFVSMNITTDAALYTGDTITEALVVVIDDMSMDISMDLSIGKSTPNLTGATAQAVPGSLGSIAINQLDLSGTKLTIYGH